MFEQAFKNIDDIQRNEAGCTTELDSTEHRAPLAHGSDQPDISRADFAWCMTAIDWGWSIEDVAVRLLEESAKARENGQRYAYDTATNAAAAVERRRASPACPEP